MADWSDLPFDVGDIDYPEQCQTLRSRSEAIATEVEDARLGSLSLSDRTAAINTELVNARQGESDLLTNLQQYILIGTQIADIDMNTKKIANSIPGVASSDAVTKTQLEAIPASPDQSAIDITDLNNGTATNGQRYIVSGGSVIGQDNTALTVDVGFVSANNVVGANAAATAMESKNLSNISTGSLSTGDRVSVKSGGDGLESHESFGPTAYAAFTLF